MLEAMILKTGISKEELASLADVNLRTVYRWINGETKVPALLIKQLKEMEKKSNGFNRPRKAHFEYIDLFAGIGGFRKCFDEIGGKCVFTSEWDKYAKLTYSDNYPTDHPFGGDIREFTDSDSSLSAIPKHDMLIAGFPCQPFSIAGVSKKNSLGRVHGFKDVTQGTLFFDLAQIIDHHRPPAILLENVKNLASHDGGNTFKIIRRTLEEELGYHITYRVVDGKGMVPQHRERVFIVGFSEPNSYDINDIDFPNPNQGPRLRSVLHEFVDSEDDYPFFIDGKVNPKYTLSDKLWNYLQEYKKKHQAKGNGFGFGLFDGNGVARTLSARYYKDGSEILIKQKGKNPRRLTPRECARIMGFDSLTGTEFRIPVSDTQAYRQFGNSVVVPVVRSIAESLKPYIKKAAKLDKAQKSFVFDNVEAL